MFPTFKAAKVEMPLMVSVDWYKRQMLHTSINLGVLGTKQGSNPCSGTKLLKEQVFGENLKRAGSVRTRPPDKIISTWGI